MVRKKGKKGASGAGQDGAGTSSEAGQTTQQTVAGGDSEKILRGRGGFKQIEVSTIPANIKQVKAIPSKDDKPIHVVSNFVKLSTMPKRQVIAYRIDFEPDVESTFARRKLFNEATKDLFNKKVIFDGMNDARSGIVVDEVLKEFTLKHPTDVEQIIKMKLKRVGTVAQPAEMVRVYNMHMKEFLRAMGFYQISTTGAYVHRDLVVKIGDSKEICSVGGFKTGANMHENNAILMNLESCSKIMQYKNVDQTITDIKNNTPRGGNWEQNVKTQMSRKLVVAAYNKVVYRVEDVNFKLKPTDTFFDKRENKDVSFKDYYKRRYNLTISNLTQPLLLVTQNNKRKDGRQDDDKTDIYVVPELCNVAGLTEQQKNMFSLKNDLIKASQVAPDKRVAHIQEFLNNLHSNSRVSEVLNTWGYTYDKEPVELKARTMKTEKICTGHKLRPGSQWWEVREDAGFNVPKLVEKPRIPKLVYIIMKTRDEESILNTLRVGFRSVDLVADQEEIQRLDADNPHSYSKCLKYLSSNVTIAIVVLTKQAKDRYDVVKKVCSCDLGLVSQVVTARLLIDPRKARSAATKIAIQVAAKLNGEPWHNDLTLPNAMVCGYDTYHDTSSRGRSFGAFIASLNSHFSRWYSKADHHDKLDELSTHMAQNLNTALDVYRQRNNRYPDNLIIYRDGVGDGQIDHVRNIELKHIRRVAKQKNQNIKITFIIVNKRIGARFFMKAGEEIKNPDPGSVIDDVVTRKGRYDFYLISQSTRNGTVTPTYYNIIEDESGFDAAKHQSTAYKLCFLYYNWAGTVRVPAPCQYAHKLALLCGESLHGIPNAILDTKLHFL